MEQKVIILSVVTQTQKVRNVIDSRHAVSALKRQTGS